MTPGIAYIKNCISHNSWDYVSDRECAYANGCAHELTVSRVFFMSGPSITGSLHMQNWWAWSCRVVHMSVYPFQCKLQALDAKRSS